MAEINFRPDLKPEKQPKKPYRLKRKPPKRAKHENVSMPVHTKVYLAHFNISPGDFIECEVCRQRAVDIHHIFCRGTGGSKTKDVIENLMAVCRKHHTDLGDNKKQLPLLIEIHAKKLGISVEKLTEIIDNIKHK